jgi:SecD/SecF fusion protein
MPGIAGVVLAFGMAVDANVLIYERIREELKAGQTLRAAVRTAFHRASAVIIDGNLCHLITCFALYWTGTTEIRGFAVTLGIGVITTLFAAMVVSRLCFDIGLAMGWKSVSTLPDAIKPLGRALLPNVDWMRWRWWLYGLSGGLSLIGIAALVYQGRDIFDNEFRGGTAVTMELKRVDPDGPGPAPEEAIKRTRHEIKEQLERHVAAQGSDSPIAEMATAEVIAINPDADQVTSSTFKIKTVVADAGAVSKGLIEAFNDILDAHPPLEVSSVRADPITQPALGENIGRPEVRDSVAEYIGGVVVVVEGLSPAVSLDELRTRLDQARAQPGHADALGRKQQVVALEGTAEAVKSAAIVSVDRSISFFDDEARWNTEVAQPEMALARDALERGTSLAGVQSFSAAIASDFAAKAITSVLLSVAGILIYLWVRFGSVRYSLAAVMADLHDAVVALGMVAVVGILYEATPGLAAALGLAPFKINLAMTASILTVLGYSLNDSIVVMDRIRENRGKLAYATREVVNRSLNQTLSRTILTGGTVVLSTMVLYLFGGEGIRGFAFAMFVGVLAGTYSSIGIAAPIVWNRRPPAARPVGAGSADRAGKALVTT